VVSSHWDPQGGVDGAQEGWLRTESGSFLRSSGLNDMACAPVWRRSLPGIVVATLADSRGNVYFCGYLHEHRIVEFPPFTSGDSVVIGAYGGSEYVGLAVAVSSSGTPAVAQHPCRSPDGL
jgi:hypothetical protein